MKWVLRYLRGTHDFCITFNNNNDYVCGFVDSYFVGDLDKRMPTSGYVFTLAGGAISWMSKLQEKIDLSSTEDEYNNASHAYKEVIWLNGLLREFGRLQNSMHVLCDKQSVIHLDTNHFYHSNTKHIDVKYHFVIQAISEGGVDLKKVHTQENCANVFTKPVLLEKLQWCVSSLGLKKR